MPEANSDFLKREVNFIIFLGRTLGGIMGRTLGGIMGGTLHGIMSKIQT